jgi:hypothetical protein
VCILSVGAADEMVKHSEHKVGISNSGVTGMNRYNDEVCVGSADGTVTLLKANDLLSSKQVHSSRPTTSPCIRLPQV